MHERYDPHSYPESCFDDDFCLKPPVLLWAAGLFLSRGAALPIVFGLGRFAGVNSEALGVLHALWRSDALIPAVFAAPVLYSLVRRAVGVPARALDLGPRARVPGALGAYGSRPRALSIRGFGELGDALPAICARVAPCVLCRLHGLGEPLALLLQMAGDAVQRKPAALDRGACGSALAQHKFFEPFDFGHDPRLHRLRAVQPLACGIQDFQLRVAIAASA
jgi:hypothetical protein